MATIFLFSSNIRRQYEQDIIDVAAAPAGSVFRFRYDEKYVAPTLRIDWEHDALTQRDVLVVYSIQQPADYHAAAYVPIRRGQISRCFAEGSTLVVEFRVTGYAPLRRPEQDETKGDLVRSFSESLGVALLGHPGHDDRNLRFSAAEGEEPTGLIAAGDTEAHAFERLVAYLSPTVSFGSTVFWRVAHVRKLGDVAPVIADAQGRFRLVSENTYEVTIAHFQVDAPPRENPPTFDVSTDSSLVEVIAPKQFAVASRYDSIPINIRVAPLPGTRETVLSIQPSPGVIGPRTDLRLHVGPTQGRRAGTAAMGAAAALLLVIPDLAGDEAPVLLRFLPHVGAAVLLAWLGWWAVPSRPK
jgi:hypothetical protein